MQFLFNFVFQSCNIFQRKFHESTDVISIKYSTTLQKCIEGPTDVMFSRLNELEYALLTTSQRQRCPVPCSNGYEFTTSVTVPLYHGNTHSLNTQQLIFHLAALQSSPYKYCSNNSYTEYCPPQYPRLIFLPVCIANFVFYFPQHQIQRRRQPLYSCS